MLSLSLSLQHMHKVALSAYSSFCLHFNNKLEIVGDISMCLCSVRCRAWRKRAQAHNHESPLVCGFSAAAAAAPYLCGVYFCMCVCVYYSYLYLFILFEQSRSAIAVWSEYICICVIKLANEPTVATNAEC